MTTRRLALVAAVLWLCAAALTVYIASLVPGLDNGLETGVHGIDLAIGAFVHIFAVQNPWAVSIAAFFGAMGSGFVLAPLTVGVVVALWVRGQRWWSVWIGACGAGGILISQIVKQFVDRQRPQWQDLAHTLTSPSFPSGHSMAGIYGYFAFGVVAWFLVNRWFGVVLMVFGLLMGPSRVVYGVHWPTDVLGGWLYASAWVCTVTAVLWWKWGPPPRPPDTREAGSTRPLAQGDLQAG